MSTRSKEEWPYVPFYSGDWNGAARWEDAASAPVASTGWMRWGVIGLFFAVIAITLVSGIALASLHRDDSRAMQPRQTPVEPLQSHAASDLRLQELIREHYRAVSSDY